MTTTRPLTGSLRQLADIFGTDRELLGKIVTEQRISAAGGRGVHKRYPVKAVYDCLIARGADGKPDPDRMPPSARHAFWKAQNEELSYMERTAQLAPQWDVRQELIRVVKIMRRGLETLPSRIERDDGVPPRVLGTVERVCDELRDELVVAMQDREAADDSHQAAKAQAKAHGLPTYDERGIRERR